MFGERKLHKISKILYFVGSGLLILGTILVGIGFFVPYWATSSTLTTGIFQVCEHGLQNCQSTLNFNTVMFRTGKIDKINFIQ